MHPKKWMFIVYFFRPKLGMINDFINSPKKMILLRLNKWFKILSYASHNMGCKSLDFLLS